MSETTWILRDGSRDLVRLEEPVQREQPWFEWQVVPLGVPRLDEYLASDPSAKSRLEAVDATSGKTAANVSFGEPPPGRPGEPERVRERELKPAERGFWAVIYEWMSRV